MNRAPFAGVATLLALSAVGAPALAQKAPEFKTLLSGRKVEPPFRGTADVEYTQPVTKRNGDVVTTTIRLKNDSPGPLARLTVAETWFDKSNAIVGGSQGTLEKMLEPGAVDTLTIQTPWNPKMNGNGFNFTHANGSVKPKRVKSVEDSSKAAAAKAPAPAKK